MNRNCRKREGEGKIEARDVVGQSSSHPGLWGWGVREGLVRRRLVAFMARSIVNGIERKRQTKPNGGDSYERGSRHIRSRLTLRKNWFS